MSLSVSQSDFEKYLIMSLELRASRMFADKRKNRWRLKLLETRLHYGENTENQESTIESTFIRKCSLNISYCRSAVSLNMCEIEYKLVYEFQGEL